MRIETRSHRLTVILAVFLLLSVVANGGLAWLCREQYRSAPRVRLDPSSEAIFVPLNASQAPAPEGIHRVLFLGDSRTEMWRVLPSVEGCQMVNRGKRGDASGQLRLRVERDAIDLRPSLVFLEIGANDLKCIGVLPDEEKAIKERLRTNVHAIIDRLTRRGIPVVVSTVFPFGDVSLPRRVVWSHRIVEAREAWNREIRGLRRPGVSVFDADAVLSSEGRLKPEYRVDELHLNDAAYQALNAALRPVIKRCLDTR